MGIAKLVGHVNSNDEWHKLKDGRTVSFHTAFFDKERKVSHTFYADDETWPSSMLKGTDFSYVLLRNATKEEIGKFLLESDIELEEKT